MKVIVGLLMLIVVLAMFSWSNLVCFVGGFAIGQREMERTGSRTQAEYWEKLDKEIKQNKYRYYVNGVEVEPFK